ncbi:MAG TPA: AIR synthase related protein, partial [Candidatus Bathyarchaeia archaeon]|nr:AIR synthase related protein [Candidatus Bathyarchaeia archaeon]
MPDRSLRIGKIPPEVLSKIVFSHLGNSNPRMVLGPGVGRDFAALSYDRFFILTTDPVTGTSRRIGQHSVYINANDIAVAGARPVWYMCTILLPEGTRSAQLSEIMRGIDTACRRLGVQV